MHVDPSLRGPRPGRVPLSGWCLGAVGALIGFVLAERERTAHRFEGFGAWRRMLALGVMLAGLAGIPVLDLTIYGLNGSYFPGMASLFAGFLQALLILKIASPEVYPDWVALGGLDILIGTVLLIDPTLAEGWSLPGFGVCFAASALIRIWIGLTFRRANAFTWIGSSGLVGLFLLGWFLVVLLTTVDFRLDSPVAADMMLRADLTLRGVALMGLGLSLRTGED